jgi:mannose-6-phosphate isomerase-like protein (cupin superfamily)
MLWNQIRHLIQEPTDIQCSFVRDLRAEPTVRKNPQPLSKPSFALLIPKGSLPLLLFLLVSTNRIGVPLHVHHEQDQWLHILAGEFVAEVGGKGFRLKPGDSLLMPMKVPHRWSIAGQPHCGAIHLYTPAGLMDISWDPSPSTEVPQTPQQNKAEFEKYGMTLLGVPLTREEIDLTI